MSIFDFPGGYQRLPKILFSLNKDFQRFDTVRFVELVGARRYSRTVHFSNKVIIIIIILGGYPRCSKFSERSQKTRRINYEWHRKRVAVFLFSSTMRSKASIESRIMWYNPIQKLEIVVEHYFFTHAKALGLYIALHNNKFSYN